MDNVFLETERLILRKITVGDIDAVYKILGDKEVMYAWEHGFSREEAENWHPAIGYRI